MEWLKGFISFWRRLWYAWPWAQRHTGHRTCRHCRVSERESPLDTYHIYTSTRVGGQLTRNVKDGTIIHLCSQCYWGEFRRRNIRGVVVHTTADNVVTHLRFHAGAVDLELDHFPVTLAHARDVLSWDQLVQLCASPLGLKDLLQGDDRNLRELVEFILHDSQILHGFLESDDLLWELRGSSRMMQLLQEANEDGGIPATILYHAVHHADD